MLRLRPAFPLLLLLFLPLASPAQEGQPQRQPSASPPQPYAELNRRLQQAQWAQQDFTTAVQQELQQRDQTITELRQQVTQLQQQLAAEKQAKVPESKAVPAQGEGK